MASHEKSIFSYVKQGYDHVEGEGHTQDHGEDGYTVTHTSRVFLVDPNGRLVTSYTFGTRREDILADVTYLFER